MILDLLAMLADWFLARYERWRERAEDRFCSAVDASLRFL